MSSSPKSPTVRSSALSRSRQVSRGCHCGKPGVARPPHCSCTRVDDTPLDTPDLAIYSQAEVLAGGGIPSWDNPDIVTNDWRPFRLREEASVTVRNLSPTTSAANARIHMYTSPFGIGTRRELQLTRVVSIGAGQPSQLLFPLHQAILAGDPRVGVHIVIEHPTDTQTVNNAGSQVHDGGYTTESGRVFDVAIPVVNDSNQARTIDLVVLPTDLLATMTPTSRSFAPFEQVVAKLHIEVPGFLVGAPGNEIARAVTVLGRSAGDVIGGVTRLLRIDS